MFAYPKNKQTSEQQLRDEYDCYTEVQQQTGINPDTPPPSAPSSADMQSVQQQASQSASSQLQHQYSQAKSAYNHQMDTFKRGFSACMDARDYSVK
jgi:hypothetical protein